MRTLFLSLTALAVVLVGCDSGTEIEAFTGPTVQFGAASVNAAEGDGTVEIPVTLSGAEAGQQITVEVLYAAASSSADFGDDVDNFGSADGANRVATVTLTGPSDTQTVTIDILEDSEPESPEAAVFVLQRASGGARIGDTREFRIEIGTPPISAIRTRDLGTIVTVEGIVTRARGRFSYIQDDSGAAIATFASGNDYAAAVASGAVAQGDRIQIVGELAEFSGLLQLSNISDFEVLSSGNDLPAVQTVAAAQIATGGDTYESELVRLQGLTLETSNVVFEANTSYNVTAGGTTVILRTSREGDTAIVGERIQPITGGTPGAYGPFTFTGVVGQFSGSNQLAPVNIDDFEED